MRFAFCSLQHSATPISRVDIEGTRAHRLAIHEQVRRRNHLALLLAAAPIGENGVWLEAGDDHSTGGL